MPTLRDLELKLEETNTRLTELQGDFQEIVDSNKAILVEIADLRTKIADPVLVDKLHAMAVDQGNKISAMADHLPEPTP